MGRKTSHLCQLIKNKKDSASSRNPHIGGRKNRVPNVFTNKSIVNPFLTKKTQKNTLETLSNQKNCLKTQNQFETKKFFELKYIFLDTFKVRKTHNLNSHYHMIQNHLTQKLIVLIAGIASNDNFLSMSESNEFFSLLP